MSNASSSSKHASARARMPAFLNSEHSGEPGERARLLGAGRSLWCGVLAATLCLAAVTTAAASESDAQWLVALPEQQVTDLRLVQPLESAPLMAEITVLTTARAPEDSVSDILEAYETAELRYSLRYSRMSPQSAPAPQLPVATLRVNCEGGDAAPRLPGVSYLYCSVYSTHLGAKGGDIPVWCSGTMATTGVVWRVGTAAAPGQWAAWRAYGASSLVPPGVTLDALLGPVLESTETVHRLWMPSHPGQQDHPCVLSIRGRSRTAPLQAAFIHAERLRSEGLRVVIERAGTPVYRRFGPSRLDDSHIVMAVSAYVEEAWEPVGIVEYNLRGPGAGAVQVIVAAPVIRPWLAEGVE